MQSRSHYIIRTRVSEIQWYKWYISVKYKIAFSDEHKSSAWNKNLFKKKSDSQARRALGFGEGDG